jgi:putative Holliday junction resolvase
MVVSDALSSISYFGGNRMIGRIMAVDPGEKRIGIAVSDETGCLVIPVTVLQHKSLVNDVNQIVQLIAEYYAVEVIVGCTVAPDGSELPQTRHAQKIADQIHTAAGIPVTLWDEWGSTKAARAVRMESGAKRSKRGGHLDDVAAALILQSYLDSRKTCDQSGA